MGLLKGLFGKKSVEPFDLSAIQVDMHSHLIPAIDDGAQSMDETIGMLLRFVELGYKKVITTPHVMSDYYKNTPDIIRSGLEKVRDEVERLNIPIEIDAAAEYFYDEFLIDRVNKKELLTFGDNYVLFEFSFSAAPNNMNDLIFTMLQNDYKPVLAHYERYLYFVEDGVKKVQDLKNRGVLIQMNLNSLSGHYGKMVKKQAEMLVDNQLVDFVGTDCHRMDHLNLLSSTLHLEYFHKLKNLNLLNSKI
jgi:tyrosine-protein phosphatase YwqE